MSVTVHHGDCIDVLRGMAEASVDSVVCDPPYHLTELPHVRGAGFTGKRPEATRAARAGFMGKTWDGGDVAMRPETWAEVYRVMKPGAHLVAFGGTRTYHRLVCAIEDAGFEIRDQLGWVYGTGFPKSLDVGKAIDRVRDDGAACAAVSAFVKAGLRAAGKTPVQMDQRFGIKNVVQKWTTDNIEGAFKPRVPTWEQWGALKAYLSLGDEMDAEVWRLNGRKGQPGEAWLNAETLAVDRRFNEPSGIVNIGQGERTEVDRLIKAPATDAAKQWAGWGTALKPAWEPVLCCAKPVTMAQHFAIIVRYMTALIAELAEWSGVPASDVGRSFPVIQAKLDAAEDSIVLDAARMRSLASIGVAPFAMPSSTFSALDLKELTKTRDYTALRHVRSSPSAVQSSGQTTHHGQAVDILTRLMDTSTSVMVGGISPSIVSSWANISADLLQAASTFTTETAIRLTIALRTLRSSISPSTSDDTGASCLSPAWEPIVLARKPLAGATVAAQVLATGTGALNVDGCRVPTDESLNGGTYLGDRREAAEQRCLAGGKLRNGIGEFRQPPGRWPANLVTDGSPEVLEAFGRFGSKGGGGKPRLTTCNEGRADESQYRIKPTEGTIRDHGDGFGNAARFFPALGFGEDELRFHYSAKASKADRAGSKHPTIKPVALMRWLCRLVTPPSGVCLDPFAGSGTTGEACLREGFSAVLIEREAEYVADIRARLARHRDEAPLLAEVAA